MAIEVVRGASRRPSGFTLIELVVVMVLLGVLSAYVAPRYGGETAITGRGFFDELLQTTRFAQKLAVASGCEVLVDYSAGGYAVWQPSTTVQCGQGGGATFDTAVAGFDEGTLRGVAPAGVTVAASSDVMFLPSGGANVTATVIVAGHSFRVHAATGYVERL